MYNEKCINFIPYKQQRLSTFNIIMKIDNKSESYRVPEDIFLKIKKELISYRITAPPSKLIECVETGEIFKNANQVKIWLIENKLTSSYSADKLIKMVCKGKRTSAYGYHWRFA